MKRTARNLIKKIEDKDGKFLVKTFPVGIVEDSLSETPSINILGLCGLLLSAIKELDNEVISLKGQIDQLEAENSSSPLQLKEERSFSLRQ